MLVGDVVGKDLFQFFRSQHCHRKSVHDSFELTKLDESFSLKVEEFEGPQKEHFFLFVRIRLLPYFAPDFSFE